MSIHYLITDRENIEYADEVVDFSQNPQCITIPDDIPNNDTYYVIVEYTDCDGNVHYDHTTIYVGKCSDGLVSDIDSSSWNGDTYTSNITYFNTETGLYDSLYTSVSPNPMTESANIAYHIPKSGNVKITLLNSNFETMEIIKNEPVDQPSDYNIQMSTESLLNGINYYMIELNNEKSARLIRRISVIK